MKNARPDGTMPDGFRERKGAPVGPEGNLPLSGGANPSPRTFSKCPCIVVKGRRMTDSESTGMLFDDAPDIPNEF